MAQSAQQLAFVGMEQAEYGKIKSKVVEALKRYPKLNADIKAAQRRSEGKGLHITPLKIDPELFQELKTVGRAYTADVNEHMHRQKAEKMFADLAAKYAINRDLLDEIAGLMTGAHAFGHEGYSYNGKVYPSYEAALEKAKDDAFREMIDLHNLQQTIEESLADLKGYAPHLEKLLRMRYLEQAKIPAVCKALGIEARTQDNWHREAIGEIAPLLGIGRGW